MSRIPVLVSVPPGGMVTALGAVGPEVTILEWDLHEQPPADRIDLVVLPRGARGELVRAVAATATTLVQSQRAGYEDVAEHLPAGVVFANAAGVHDDATAEFAMALILTMQRGIPHFLDKSRPGSWAPIECTPLNGRTVAILGYGGVGRAVEDRLSGFGVNVLRVAQRSRTDPLVYAIGDLPRILPRTDILVVAVPLTAATRGLIRHELLALLPTGALVVNVARGAVIDREALREHASRGRLRFGLDVTDPEPLPTNDPLRHLPNVLITPHVAGRTADVPARIARLVDRQIQQLAAGLPPLNVVLPS